VANAKTAILNILAKIGQLKMNRHKNHKPGDKIGIIKGIRHGGLGAIDLVCCLDARTGRHLGLGFFWGLFKVRHVGLWYL